jgi:hypothetical protein
MVVNTFVQKQPWYVKPITVHDICCCRYQVDFELYYNPDFCNFVLASSHPSTTHAFISQVLCEREGDELFYQKNALVERMYHYRFISLQVSY